MQGFSRRDILFSAVGLGASGIDAALASPMPGLGILAAPTGASVVLAEFLASHALQKAAPGATFRLWRTTDDLRAAIISGRTQLFSTPTHVPANLAARGMPLRLLCLIGLGHLAVVTTDQSIRTLHDLAGKPILTFFRHDMPDLVFRALAKMEGMDPNRDFRLTYVQSGMEAGQMLAAGRVETALLSEPMATSAILMAAKHGRQLRRAILLNDLWAKHKSRAGIPMVGLALHTDILRKSPEIVAALRAGIKPAAARVMANKKAAAALASRQMGFPAAMFEASLDHLNIAVRSAVDAKNDLALFYRTLLDLEPQSLGGKLPPDEFYLDL